MGCDRKGKAVTEKTPEEILAAIDKALEETAASIGTARPKRRLYPIRSGQPGTASKPETPEEILDAIDRALEETHRRFAEAATDRPART
jgi:predicted RNase H-like HicB family nuclease